MLKKTQTPRFFMIVLLLSLAIVGLLWENSPAGLSAKASSLKADIVNAWNKAEASGVYTFKTQVKQTTYPNPSLTNVGRTSQTDNFSLDGQFDRSQEQMNLTFYQGAGRNANTAVPIQIKGNEAFGQTPDGQWQKIDNVSNIFAPGGDPLGYLSAATNVSFIGTQTYTAPIDQNPQADGGSSPSLNYKQYAFDLDGEAFADYIRSQLERQLQESGKLPAGISLSTPEVYRDAKGSGQIWLDETGLPSRMTAKFTMPPQDNGEPVEIDLQTDFSNFDRTHIAIAQATPFSDLSTWATSTIFLPENVKVWETAGLRIGLLLALSVFLIYIAFTHKRKFTIAFNIALIVAIISNPFLQSQKVGAFYQDVQTQKAQSADANAQQTASSDLQAKQAQNVWNPHQNPVVAQNNPTANLPENILSVKPAAEKAPSLNQARTGAVASLPKSSSVGITSAVSVPSAQNAGSGTDLNTTDTDGDGLIDSDEINVWGTDINNPDTDGDGLPDGTEVHDLGTSPTLVDSDGDGIPDNVEVKGFTYNNQQWYLNPLEIDTNHDGMPDGMECPALTKLATGGTICPDTDNDGIPDVFDPDNDNDGVPDQMDTSPNSSIGSTTTFFDKNHPFSFSVSDVAAGTPTLVDFQIRPVNPDHLYFSGSVLDWPSNDSKGQIKRYQDTTFASTSTSDLRSKAPNASNGDMMLTPMLEITIPFDATTYGDLPVRQDITDPVKIDGWLDTTALLPYGISVQQNATNNELYVYVPLNTVQDDTGGALSAMSAQMVYWPKSGNWGNPHQYRVVWVVENIVNTTPYAADSAFVSQVYTDEQWYITGLNVREDHGMQVAIMGEDPAVDADLTQDDATWQLATSLSLTFSEGIDCLPTSNTDTGCTKVDDNGLTIDEIYNRLNHSTNAGVDARYRWYIDNTIAVKTISYPHQGYLAQIAMTDTPAFLDTYYSQHTDAIPLLIFAYQNKYRGMNLDEATPASNLTLDLTNQNEFTQNSLTVKSFRYDNGHWQAYALDEYLDHLSVQLRDRGDFQSTDPTSDYSNQVVEGKIVAMQLFYTTLYQGVNTVTGINGQDFSADAIYTQQALGSWFSTSFTSLIVDKIFVLLWGRVNYAPEDLLYSLATLGGKLQQGEGSLALFKSIYGGKSALAIGGLLAGITILTYVALAESNKAGLRVLDSLVIVATSLSAAVSAVQMVNLMRRLVVEYNFVTGLIKSGWTGLSVFTWMSEIGRSARAGTVVGLIVSVALTWGLVIYLIFTATSNKYQKNALVAYGVAATVTTILLFALLFIPVIGELIVLIIVLYDSVTYIVCETLEATGHKGDKTACEGITGMFTEALAKVFYTAKVVASLDKVDYSITGPDFVYPDAGITTANAVTYHSVVTQTIFTGEVDRQITGQHGAIKDDAGYAEKTTVVYQLQTSDAQLQNWDNGYTHWDKTITQDWHPCPDNAFNECRDGTLSHQYTDDLTLSFADVGTGINNQLPQTFLTVAYALPVKECSFGICWVDNWQKDQQHMQIGDFLYFDIFPPTLDGFYSLVAKDGGYALAWGQGANADLTFPRLKDADNDGLINAADGGSDPNDSKWDTDGDGLSDFFELSHGLDPQNVDTDHDGVSDYDEIRAGTNPLSADSDGDGLPDKVELQGWLTGYVDDAGNIQTTRVTSDPYQADTDGDGLTDNVEYIYGLNPRVAEPKDVVDNALTFANLRVDENASPQMLLQFEEAAGPTFGDATGNSHSASCDPTNCPTAAAGRYGQALYFNGSQDLKVKSVTNTSFTFGGWFKRDQPSRYDVIMSGGSLNSYASLYLSNKNQAECIVFYNSFSFGVARSSQTFTSTDWHHWVCTFDGNSKAINIYRDGVSVANGVLSGSISTSGLGDEPWYIGSFISQPSNFVKGALDEMLVYDYAMSADQVAALRDGSYNLDDLVVQPGAALTYQMTAQNNLLARNAQGHFYVKPETEPSPLNVDKAYQSFTLAPQKQLTIKGAVDVAADAGIGVYPLDLATEGVIDAPDESNLFLSLPKPDLGYYFENNQFGADANSYISPTLGNGVAAKCPNTEPFGNQEACPSLVDSGFFGRALEFNGSDQSLLVHGTQTNNDLNLMDGSFSVGAWIYPDSTADTTTRQAILGYSEPDRLWFDFRGYPSSTTSFPDEAGVYSATCSGSACPDATSSHDVHFDGVDDILKIANNANINLGTRHTFSLMMDYNILGQDAANQTEVLYEQGGSNVGLNIYADNINSSYAQLHVCAWDLISAHSWGPNCISFYTYLNGVDRRLIVTFAGNPNSSSTAGTMSAYLNGVLQGNTDVWDLPQHTNGIGIGGVNSQTHLKSGAFSGSAYFYGWMNTLAFFPTALTQADATFYQDNYSGENFPTLYVKGDTLGVAYAQHGGGFTSLQRTDLPSFNALRHDQWNHLTLTYDDLNKVATLYFNGVQVWTASADLATPFHDKRQFRLGWAGGQFGHFQGKIDSVDFYDRVLTTDQVANLTSLFFDENEVLHLALDEVPGATQFQYGYDTGEYGTCSGTGCPTAGLRGLINWAAYFDGNDRISMLSPYAASTNYDHFSVSAWVKASQGTIFDFTPNAGSEYIRLRTNAFTANNGAQFTVPFSGVSGDNWYHVVATYDSGDAMRVYVNGSQVASTPLNGSPVTIDPTGFFSLGSQHNGSTPLTGYLDDVRLYEVTLSSSQIQALYQQSAPALQFRFDEDGLATQVHDNSQNGLVGNVVGAQPGVLGRLGNGLRIAHPTSDYSEVDITSPGPVIDAMDNNFTIMTWIKTDAYNPNRDETIFEWTHGGIGTQVLANGTKNYRLYGTPNNPANVPFVLGQWDFLAVTVDAYNLARYYVNGVLIYTTTYTTPTGVLPYFEIGQQSNNVNAGLVDTTLDEFTIYHRALSSLEIADTYRLDSRWYTSVGTFRITVDTDAPSVALRSDTGYRLNQSTVLDVETSDPTSRVTLVDMGIKSPTAADYVWQGAPACLDAEPGAAWCPTFDPTKYEGEGRYELVFRAVDAAGNQTTSQPYVIYVDGTPPQVGTSANGDWVKPSKGDNNTWTVPLQGSISDPALSDGSAAGSGINPGTVQVTLFDENGDTAGQAAQAVTLSNNTWQLDYTFNGKRPNGLYTIEIHAVDLAGNIITQTIGSVRLDTYGGHADLYQNRLDNNVQANSTVQARVASAANAPSQPGLVPNDILTAADKLSGTVSDLPQINGAVLDLHFEESNGSGTYLDSSGLGNNATCTNCPTQTTGVFGSALAFNGVDNTLTVAAADSLNVGPALTLAAWVNPDVIPASGVARFVTYGTGKAVLRIENGKLHFYMNIDGVLQHIRVADVLTAGEWQHIAGTYDGQTMRLYRNGILLDSLAVPGSLDDSSKITINSAGEPFMGKIDEVTLYNRALTESEVYDLAQSQLAKIAGLDYSLELLGNGSVLNNLPLPSGALLQLPLEDASSETDTNVTASFTDFSGAGHNATCDGDTCPTPGVMGVKGSAVEFDGQNDYLTVPALLNPSSSAFTAGVWINLKSLGSVNQEIMQQTDVNGTGRTWLGIQTDGKLFSFLGGSNLTSPQSVSPGEWHYAAVSYDGTTVALYLDGQLVSSAAKTMEPSDGALLLGSGKQLSNYFTGQMDEAAVFNRALSLTELRQLMLDVKPTLNLGFDENKLVNGDSLDTGSEMTLTAQLVSNDNGDKHVTGQVDAGALALDGNGDYVAVSSSPYLDLSQGTFTQMAWVYPQPADGQAYPILSSGAYAGDNQAYPFIEVIESSKLRVGFGDGTNLYSYTTGSVLSPNVWNHIAVTFDSQNLRVYVNGTEVGTTTAMSGVTPYPTQQFDLGRNADRTFQGQLDAVQIYSRALSAAEVAEQSRISGWQPVTLDHPNTNLSTWNQTLPQLEGMYRIKAHTADGFNNISDPYTLWEGDIDTMAPRVSYTTRLVGSGDNAKTEYNYTVTDYHLDPNGLTATCLDPNPAITPFDSLWNRVDLGVADPLSATSYQLSGTCQVDDHHPEPVTLQACDSLGNCATVTVQSAPTITTQPQDTSIFSGQTATFTVVASGDGLSYQWYQGTSGDTSTPVGSDSDNFTTPALTADTSYWVRVSNPDSSADSDTTTVTVQSAPNITTQPQDTSIFSGQTATFSVAASGNSLSYQWYQGSSGDTSTPVGSDSDSFTTPALTADTSYWVRVSNPAGNTDSNTATVTLQVGLQAIILLDSQGKGLAGATAQYYLGGWKDIPGSTGSDGTLSYAGLGLSGNLTFRISYAHASIQKIQNIDNDPEVIFQTTVVSMQLLASDGTTELTGKAEYYAGSWNSFGSGSTTASMELLPTNYTFRVSYGGASVQKKQDVSSDPAVIFQTTVVSMQLLASDGATELTGKAEYYAGVWNSFGSGSTTTSMELLPTSYTFRVSYGGASIQKKQDVGSDPSVIFQTMVVSMKLLASDGTTELTGKAEYYAGSWNSFGSGTTTTSMELLPTNYTFRVSYGGASVQKNQDASSDPAVVFQTAVVSMKLLASDSTTELTGKAEYYAGSWNSFGSGSTTTSMELLPTNYTFRVSYGGASVQKNQDVSSDPAVIFQTTVVSMKLLASDGTTELTGKAEYYAGSWNTFGSGSTTTSMEMLPTSYTFRVTYGGANIQKKQDVSSDPAVVFQTGTVHSDSGTATQYYASAWQTFTQDMELLPGDYPFRFSDGTPQTTFTLSAESVNHIH